MADTYVGEDSTVMAVRNAIADAELKRRKLMQTRLGADEDLRKKPANPPILPEAFGNRRTTILRQNQMPGSPESVFPALMQAIVGRR